MTRQKLSIVEQARAAMPGLDWTADPEDPACAVGRDWTRIRPVVYIYRNPVYGGAPGVPWVAASVTASGTHATVPRRTCAAALRSLPRWIRECARGYARDAALARDAARDLQRRLEPRGLEAPDEVAP